MKTTRTIAATSVADPLHPRRLSDDRDAADRRDLHTHPDRLGRHRLDEVAGELFTTFSFLPAPGFLQNLVDLSDVQRRRVLAAGLSTA